jgi:hypothetical protein
MMPAPLKKVGLVSVITLLSFMVALFLAEFFIKKLDKYQSRALLDYGDTMRPGGLGPGGYLNENVTLYVTDGLGGKVRWTNNAAGFRNDRDVKQYPLLGVLRILTLGDSFNAGYRVGQEQTFSFLLEQWINRQWGKSEILVSNIEEPTTALYYLNKFGLQFHPHIVLLGITLGNDIVQTYIGMDPKGGYAIGEYNGNASIEKTTGSIGVSAFESYDIPAIDLQPRSFFDVRIDSAERWLNRFHLVRRLFPNDLGIMSWHIDADIPKLFDINNGLGVFLKPAPPMIEEAYQRLFRVIALMQKICQKHQIIFAVQLFPQRFQVQPADWERTVAHYRLKKPVLTSWSLMQKLSNFVRNITSF